MSVHDSEPIRQSVEVEYWVIDEDGRLVDPGPLVEATPGAEREFVEPVLEIKTTPCGTTADLREELLGRIRTVLELAAELGKGLVPLATPIYADEIQELPSDRTRVQNCVVGEDFEYVRHCAGTHIHVEQRLGRAVDQLNALVAIDPALALVSSSPYFRGQRIADGARSKLYRWMAYNSVPHQGWLWSYVSDEAEWNRRLERRYEDFVTAAVDAGIDRHTVEANFDPESAVWTPVQLRGEFGTVEWRSPDTALPSQVVQLTDDVTDFVGGLRNTDVRIDGDTGRVTDDEVVLPEFDAVLDYVDDAIREGTADAEVCAYLDRMGFDVDAYDPISQEVDGREPVSPETARELRLEYADRLERDVRRADRARLD
ncbi:glutamate-cysteine ligase family protein [Haloarcula salina]|uniref:glutamate-cysteine ligase family protein n=1 Tax=Haloarcula salina TaxID=1429914 RepID=UPI003C703CC6